MTTTIQATQGVTRMRRENKGDFSLLQMRCYLLLKQSHHQYVWISSSQNTSGGTQLPHSRKTSPISAGKILRVREPGSMLCPRHVRNYTYEVSPTWLSKHKLSNRYAKWMRSCGFNPIQSTTGN